LIFFGHESARSPARQHLRGERVDDRKLFFSVARAVAADALSRRSRADRRALTDARSTRARAIERRD
jgi:hypothetical protein